MVSTYTDRKSNGIHGKLQQYNTHGDVTFIQIREKYKKHENILIQMQLLIIYFLSIFWVK